MLTYSCPTGMEQNPIANKEELQDFLVGLAPVKSAVTSEELHENGKKHYHSYLMAHNKFITRNQNYFNFKGVHPNIGTRENQKAMVRYVTKQGNYVVHNFDVDKLLKMKKAETDQQDFQHALKLASEGKLVEAKQHLQNTQAKAWCISNGSILSALDQQYSLFLESKRPMEIKVNWKTELQHVDLNEMINGEDYMRTHVLCGPAGIGKTQLAKFLLQKAGCTNIVVVTTAEQLKKHHNFDGFVFDELNANAVDVRGGRWTHESQICLVDQVENRVLPARYGDCIIPRHVKRIITTNYLSRALNVEEPAIARRVTVHILGDEKLY